MFATKYFEKGSFLLEYKGKLILKEEAERREKEYEKRRKGSYMFFFIFEGKAMW